MFKLCSCVEIDVSLLAKFYLMYIGKQQLVIVEYLSLLLLEVTFP